MWWLQQKHFWDLLGTGLSSKKSASQGMAWWLPGTTWGAIDNNKCHNQIASISMKPNQIWHLSRLWILQLVSTSRQSYSFNRYRWKANHIVVIVWSRELNPVDAVVDASHKSTRMSPHVAGNVGIGISHQIVWRCCATTAVLLPWEARGGCSKMQSIREVDAVSLMSPDPWGYDVLLARYLYHSELSRIAIQDRAYYC